MEQRPAFLERACGSDRELYTQVRELLRSDSTSEKFLDTPAITPLSKVLADAAAEAAEPVPARIGPYAVHKPLGSGGMGAVYLAYRADKSYDKQVAIKVIHRGMESDRILQRFRRERQIVASLDHPNIARLLDGGATDDGRPYIVMEYVDGLPVDKWCDQKRLNTTQRLHLFLQICDAIQYAHQNLVIHRDIKPGNILVRPDNTVKLLDFGIAKLMNPEISATPTEKTATSMRLMTPQYASPEQIRGEAVTTASDVYLLGIVLYELLTGHRPYEVKDDAPLEAIRAFAQGEPQKPSEAIFRTAERINSAGQRQVTKNALIVSALRDGTPAQLIKRLQGDLDAILLRALRRNPTERYQSTAQLAQDIRNHLQILPISAVPDTPAYRARLFFRRNTTITLAAAAAIALLLSVTIFALWQAQLARTERLRADARFAEVRKLSNTLLFDVQESLAPLPGTTPARRMLVEKALHYLTNMSKEPTADPSLQRELAAGYLRVGHLQGSPDAINLGDTAGAIASYQRAQTLLDELYKKDPKHPQTANDLATVQEALASILSLNGDSAAALPLLRQAASLREETNAPAAAKIDVYHSLAAALAQTGNAAEAITLARKAHQLASSLTGVDAPRQQAISHTRLATVLQRNGETLTAAESLRTALTLYQQLASANPVAPRPKRELSYALEALADNESLAGNSAAATPLYQRSLQLRRELAVSDPQNPQARRDLAFALLKLGSTDDAIESFRQLSTLDPANVQARRDLAHAHLRAATPASAQAAIQILDTLLAKDPQNALFLRDRAQAQWTLARSLSASAKQPADWRAAEAALTQAAQRLDALSKTAPLPPDLRAVPQQIAKLLETARQSSR